MSIFLTAKPVAISATYMWSGLQGWSVSKQDGCSHDTAESRITNGHAVNDPRDFTDAGGLRMQR
jgi:hypothetical protein